MGRIGEGAALIPRDVSALQGKRRGSDSSVYGSIPAFTPAQSQTRLLLKTSPYELVVCLSLVIVVLSVYSVTELILRSLTVAKLRLRLNDTRTAGSVSSWHILTPGGRQGGLLGRKRSPTVARTGEFTSAVNRSFLHRRAQ